MRPFLLAVVLCLCATPLWSQDLPVRADHETLFSRLKWPDAATIYHLEGTVTVRAWVNREGYVTKAIILRSAAEPLDSAYIRAVRNTRFKPRVVAGKTMEGVIDMSQSFQQLYGGIGVDAYELVMLNYTRMLEQDAYATKERSAERFYARGMNHFVHGFEDAAREDFTIAQSLGSTARWYEDVLMERCAAELPRDTAAYDSLLMYANVLATYGLVRRAMPIYTRLLFVDPKHRPTLLAAAYVSASMRDEETARRYYLIAYRLDTTDARAALAAAWYCYLYGDMEQAIEIGRQAVRLDPDDHNATANLALYLLCDGQWPEATRIYSDLRRQNNTNAQYTLLKDLKRHIGMGFPHADIARSILAEVFEVPPEAIP